MGSFSTVIILSILCALTVLNSPALQAQTLSVIHTFTGGEDGGSPYAGVVMDKAGNLYGTTGYGGVGYGNVYKLSYKGGRWVLNPLYSFLAGNDGVEPDAGVVFGPDGSLYGTTRNGGGTDKNCTSGCGIVFNLRPSATAPVSVLSLWDETVIYRLQGAPDGEGPQFGSLAFDSTGAMYGTTAFGGQHQGCARGSCGTVYKVAKSGGNWTESVLYAFTGENDGAQPYGGVVFDNAGNLYSTTYQGGAYDYGTVFQLTPSQGGWTKKTVYEFTGGVDGGNPLSGLIPDDSGSFYGTTFFGGPNGGGTVFEITPAGGGRWNFSTLYGFTAQCYGCGPVAPLTMDAVGNLYGTTLGTGPNGGGVVFKLSPAGSGWTYTLLHEFTGGSDGGLPFGQLIVNAMGNLYGTANVGGSGCAPDGCGVVWEITP